MRPRYLILAGKFDPGQGASIGKALSRDLPISLKFGTLHILTNADTPVIALPCSEGAVIGTLFETATGQRVVHMPSARDHAITSTKGALLVEQYWGNYAAIWSDPARGLCLLRDPAGSVPALVHASNDLLLIASDASLAYATGLVRPAVRWDSMPESLLYPQLSGRDTMLADLTDTIPGTCHSFADGRIDDVALWSPARFTDTGNTISASQHAASVRAAVDRTVASWRSCFDTVGLELSGGLDSSIVAAALGRTDKPWSAISFVTPGADGDERRYARAVAELHGVSLHEVGPAPHRASEEGYRRLTPRPRGVSFLGPLDTVMSEAADAVGAQAMFTGLGGDHVFFKTQSTAPVLDAFAFAGWPLARKTAHDLARLCNVPLADVYASALRRIWTHRRGGGQSPDRSYVASRDYRPPPHHPWLEFSRHTTHGARAKIRLLLKILPFLDGVDRTAERIMVSPLLSQPVVEASLAVPSWLCVAGGRDRSVARQAFADRLPEAVLWRVGKGRLDSLLVGRFEQDRLMIRSLLLDGLLAGAGLLDRRELEQDLSRPASDRQPFQDRLMQLVDAELWTRAVRSAAAGEPASR